MFLGGYVSTVKAQISGASVGNVTDTVVQTAPPTNAVRPAGGAMMRKEMTPAMRVEMRVEMRAKLEQTFTNKKEGAGMQKEGAGIQNEKRDDKRSARVEKAKKHLVAIVERFTFAVTRFEGIIARMESRLAKISEAGGNISLAKKYITLAKGDLDKARINISNLPTVWEKDTAAIETTDTTGATEKTGVMQTKKEAFKALHALIKAVKNNLVDAHKNFALAISTAKSTQKSTDIIKVETQAPASTESI